MKFVGRAMYFCMGVHTVKIVGKPVDASEAPLLVCAPHTSFFDTVALFVGPVLLTGVSRIENGQAPLFGSTYIGWRLFYIVVFSILLHFLVLHVLLIILHL